MLPKKVEEEAVLACNSCGYREKAREVEGYRLVKTAGRREEVAVIEEGAKPALPTTKAECSRCGCTVAYWWLRQTRAADEATTRFYRCTKCDHVWREYT